MPRPVTITDDRGERVPLFAPGSLDLREPENAELADAYMRAAETTNEHGWNRHLKGREALWLVAPVLLVPGMIAVMNAFPGLPRWMTYLVVVPVMWAFIMLRARSHVKEHSHRYAQAFLTRARCASCGYSLRGVDAAGEVVVCPECGAGWGVARVGLAEPAGERADERAGPVRAPSSWRAQWNRAPSIVDAKERSLPLVEPDTVAEKLRAARGEDDAAAVLRDIHRLTRGHAWVMLFWVVLGAAFAVGYVVFSAVAAGTTRANLGAVAVAVVIVTAGPWWVAQVRRAFKGRAQRTAADVAALLRKNGVCPACGEVLQAGEGVVACRCGAEWERSGRAGE
jgi:uncharacterized Zn finger protein (UPF0148 family)